MGWELAAGFGANLAKNLADGNDAMSQGTLTPQYTAFNPNQPITITTGGIEKGSEPGLLDFSIGKNLDPSTFTGAVVTSVIAGTVLLAVGLVLKK